MLAQYVLAWMYGETGEPEREEELLERTLREARAADNKRITAYALTSLGSLVGRQGRFDDALAQLREAYDIHQGLGQRAEVPDVLGRVARVLATAGKPAEAARVLAKAEALRQEMGLKGRPYQAEMKGRTLAAIRSHLDEVTFARAWAEGPTIAEEEAFELALHQGSLAE